MSVCQTGEYARRNDQGIYRSVSARGLKHKGEIATVAGSRAFVDSDGQGSIAIGKVCPSKRSGDLPLGLGEES